MRRALAALLLCSCTAITDFERFELDASPTLELDASPTLELDASPTLELDASPTLELDASPTLELDASLELDAGESDANTAPSCAVDWPCTTVAHCDPRCGHIACNWSSAAQRRVCR